MILTLVGAIVIGMSLGLLGSGGSILTIPVLIFILQRPEKLAIAESLAIVGCIALIGSIPYALQKQIHWLSVLFFGLPGMLGAWLGGYSSYYISGTTQLIVFSLVMLIMASIMLFFPIPNHKSPFCYQPNWLMILEGFGLGCLTGCIGIGGGFLIVPALVLFTGLSMTLAIGTSLMIISINAFTGFFQHLIVLINLHLQVDWSVIGIVSMAGIAGSLIGSLIGKILSQTLLRKLFGVNILVIGIYILFKQTEYL